MIKKICNFILNLIMSVLVLVLICINLSFDTFYSKDYIKEKLIENKFYDRAYTNIKENFENYTMQSGLELDILDGLVTKEKVIADIDSKLDYIYGGKKSNIETDSIRNELDSRINDALKKNHRVPNENEKASISKYEDAIVDCYKSGILYGKDFSISDNYLKKARNIAIIGIIIISICLIIINRNILKYLACVGINLLFSGILCVAVKFLIEKRILHILILDAKFSNFLVNTLVDIIDRFYKSGILFVILGIIFIIIGSFEKMKKGIEKEND